MITVTAAEAKIHLDHLLDQVANGEEVIITRDGQPIARIIPEARRNLSDIRQAVAGLRKLQDEMTARNAGKEPLTWEEVKSMIEEGRR